MLFQLNVELTQAHLCVELKKTGETILEADFFEKIKLDESFWSVEDHKNLIINAEKAKEIIWASCFKGHKEIDTKKVDNAKRLEEFDWETQVKLFFF